MSCGGSLACASGLYTECYRTNSPSKLMQSTQSLFKEMLTQTAKCSRMEKSLPINKKATNPKVQVQRLCTLTKYDGMFANVRPDSLRHQSQHKDRLLCQGRHHHRFNRGRTAKLDPPQMFALQIWWPIRRFCFGYQPFRTRLLKTLRYPSWQVRRAYQRRLFRL